MKRMLKRLAILGIIVFAILIGGVWVLTALYDEAIGQRVLGLVNDQLTTEMRLEGFDISLLRTFPNVGANLKGVEIDDLEGNILLEAGEMSFRLSLLSFLSRNYQLRSVVISDAALRIAQNERGQPNYAIFKAAERPSASRGRETGIHLEKAQLHKVELIYLDETNAQEGVIRILDATLGGEFTTRRFLMDARAEMESRFWEQDGVRYLGGTPIDLDARILVDLDQKQYELQDVVFHIGPNRFVARGMITTEDGLSSYDIDLTNEDGSLAGVIELLPESYRKALGDLNSKGRFSLQASLKGQAKEQELPAISARFALDDGRIISSKLMEDLKDVTLEASFTNGKDRTPRTSMLEIKRLVGYFNRERIEARMSLRNLDDPFVDLQVDGALPMEAIYGLFGLPDISDGEGEIEIEDLSIQGQYADMVNTGRIGRVNATGRLRFDDAGLKINDRRILLDRGNVRIQDNLLQIEGLKLEGPGTELEFNGRANNLLPVLFADSLNTQEAELRFTAELEGDELNIEELLAAFDITLSEEAKEELNEAEAQALRMEQIQNRERLTRLLEGTFQTRIESFSYGRIEGRDFDGKLNFKNNKLNIYGTTKAMGGAFTVDGDLYFERRPRLVAELESKQVEASEFFRQANNFGQDMLTDKNISGRLDARMVIMAFFDELGRFEQDKLQVLANMRIAEGELRDFKMLENFSAVLKHRDLERIRFSDLENYLEIRDERLYLPVMFIQSSAANLTLSGEHTFSNEYLYNIKVNVLQAIGQKIRRHDPELHPIPARQNGFVNLYYQIRGNESEYEVRKAKRAVKDHFEQTGRQRMAIQQALRQSFGMEIKPLYEPNTWEDIPEYRADPADEAEEFLDWEIQGGEEGGKF